MSPATAKTHVARIMSKLHARDRAQLVVVAYETALVTPRRLSRTPPGGSRGRRPAYAKTTSRGDDASGGQPSW